VGKNGVLEHKSGNISETCTDRGKVTIGSLQELTFALSNGTIPDPLRPLRTPPKTPIAIISGTGKGINSKFGQYIQRFHPNKSPLKFFGEKGAWAYPRTAHFFREREKLRISDLASILRGSIRAKTHEKFCRKGTIGVSRDCPNFLGTPIISGTEKATDFKFGQYIQRVHPK